MPRKRRGYSGSDLKRGAPRRDPYDRVLIVCEGEKTEPQYFREACDHYQLSNANIEVMPGEGNDPVSVVGTARARQNHEKKLGEKYDQIFCVFDRDEHPNYPQACRQAKTAKFTCAVSNPCFEYWLLLHFSDSRAPYARTGDRTAAQNCERELKKHRPDYAKGQKGLFGQLLPRLPEAKVRAERIWADAQRTGEENPSTRVYQLVDYLHHLKGGHST